MAVEIERKFRVRSDEWRLLGKGTLYRQGYLSTHPERTVRVRVAGEQAFLTVKGRNQGAARAEFEFPIPLTDAGAMLDHLCERPLIEKTRYVVLHAGHTWEVVDFHGENAGLVIAEVELQREDERFELPPWVGEEVTGDARFYNSSLIAHPFSRWGAAQGT